MRSGSVNTVSNTFRSGRAIARRVLGLLACATLLASCASSPSTWDKDTRASIDHSLAKAQASTKPAALPPDVSRALMPPLRVQIPEAERKPLEPRFDVAVNNAPARQVFMGLVQGTPYSVVLPNDLTGTVSLNLKNVTVPEAMDALRRVYGYEYRREDNRFLVLPGGMQTRLFPVNYLNVTRQGQSETRVASGELIGSGSSGATAQPTATTGQATPTSIDLKTQSKTDFWANLESTVKTLIGTEGGRKVVVNPDAGLLIVRAMPDELRTVAEFLRTAQRTVDRQVVLEAKILEVDLNSGFQTGVNWANLVNNNGRTFNLGQTGGGTILPDFSPSDIAGNGTVINPPANGNLFNTTASAFGGIFSLALRSSHFSAFIELLQTQGKVNVLSSPRVSTVNNQRAVIKVGGDEFFVTGVNNAITAVGNNTVATPTVQLQPFFSGIALDVTPQIDNADTVVLHIHPAVTDVTQKNKSFSVAGQQFNLPLAASSVQESDNVVRASSGQIIVIGGLMKEGSTDENASVPLLGDIPVLGNLFKHKRITRIKRELVILLKPTVVNSNQVWSDAVRESQDRIDALGRPR